MKLLIQLRADARAAKDFATGDTIRNKLRPPESPWKTEPAGRSGCGHRCNLAGQANPVYN